MNLTFGMRLAFKESLANGSQAERDLYHRWRGQISGNTAYLIGWCDNAFAVVERLGDYFNCCFMGHPSSLFVPANRAINPGPVSPAEYPVGRAPKTGSGNIQLTFAMPLVFKESLVNGTPDEKNAYISWRRKFSGKTVYLIGWDYSAFAVVERLGDYHRQSICGNPGFLFEAPDGTALASPCPDG